MWARRESITLISLTPLEDKKGGKSRNYLNCDKQADTGAHLRRVSIHPSHHIDYWLPDGNDHSKHWRIQKTIMYLFWRFTSCTIRQTSHLCGSWEGIQKSQNVQEQVKFVLWNLALKIQVCTDFRNKDLKVFLVTKDVFKHWKLRMNWHYFGYDSFFPIHKSVRALLPRIWEYWDCSKSHLSQLAEEPSLKV